ncbi:MAG: hypothetical protein V7784_16225 [Oceanospirillaceae bacterium]
MSPIISRIASLIISLWVAKVFLSSLPYKFTDHPDTLHIFGTIGQWMSDTIAVDLGVFFASYGAYIVGTVELIAASILLVASAIWALRKASICDANINEQNLFLVGGLLSAAIMSGAAFFHLFTPLGIEVIHEGGSDGGSLFYAAVSIFFLGLILAFINKPTTNS